MGLQLGRMKLTAPLNADMTSFTKMECHVGAALGTIILVSAQA
jgi:hypothetical protein